MNDNWWSQYLLNYQQQHLPPCSSYSFCFNGIVSLWSSSFKVPSFVSLRVSD